VFHFGEPFVRLSVFDSILKYNPELTAADLRTSTRPAPSPRKPVPRCWASKAWASCR
jgi:lysyl-tRNA synthetase class 2